jgi:hypothetical protein
MLCLDHPTPGRVTADHEMLDIATAIYHELYKQKQVDGVSRVALFDRLPMLSQQDRAALENDLIVTVCANGEYSKSQ